LEHWLSSFSPSLLNCGAAAGESVHSLELTTPPHERLRELGLELPAPPAAVASYVPTRLVPIGAGRALLYVAGQVPVVDGKRLTGRCPDEVSVEEAQASARICALNVLAQMESAAGLDNVEQVTQLIGFVLSANGFGDQPKVINGASDLIVDVLGEAGRHTRVALGTNALPFSVTVEIAAVAVVRTR
jgi:enamine deaminase RidA (YjgF/YER057c/UK114 family)